MYRVITFDKEENCIKDFLEIPRQLYSADEFVQNEKEERELLLEKHLLSKYFKIYKFIVYKGQIPCARCILTIYPDDNCSYIGLFECENDVKCAELLFDEVNKISKQQGFVKIKGPVDASFWIKYRLKTNNFKKKPYVSEPYNKDYYLDLFLACGYKIIETYVSNYYPKVPLFSKVDNKCTNRYHEFLSKGYSFKSISVKDFDKELKQIYSLIIELYKDFPIFKSITEEDFIDYFSKYKFILDPSIVRMAYYKGNPEGFVIAMPDYGNLLYGKIGILKYFKILSKKIRSSSYVVLYMGVRPEHVGLGSALTQAIIKNAQIKRATTIGALIKQGKVTQHYVNSKIISTNKYVLLEYEL